MVVCQHVRTFPDSRCFRSTKFLSLDRFWLVGRSIDKLVKQSTFPTYRHAVISFAIVQLLNARVRCNLNTVKYDLIADKFATTSAKLQVLVQRTSGRRLDLDIILFLT